MNKLLEELLGDGFKAQMHNNRISISLSKLTMPVLVVHNIASNTYEVKIQYWRYILMTFAMLLSLTSANSSGDIFYTSLFSFFMAYFFIAMIVVHIKSRELRERIDAINI